MTDSAAFFDLDRTLISGASTFSVGIEAWRQGLASNVEIFQWAAAALSFKLLGDRGQSSEDIRGAFLTRISGSPAKLLDDVGRAVLPKLVNRVRPESRKLLNMHKVRGRDTWIVSAAPEVLVEPLAASLGMTGAIGTKGEVVDGVYTGGLDGPFVYGPGKAAAIHLLTDQRGYDLERCYAYSDSVSDLPMLETVGHPVAVNPDSELDAIAHERGWPVVIFSRRTKRAIAASAYGSLSLGTAAFAYYLGRKHGSSRRLGGATIPRILDRRR